MYNHLDITGKRILVTGSEGFIGKNLVIGLNSLGAEVSCFDIIRDKDIRLWKELRGYRNIDLIYHLAAIMNVQKSFDNPLTTYEVNLLGTMNVAELARRENAKIIFTSSYIYGIPQYLPVDENHPKNPTNPYTKSKLLAEEILSAYNKDFGVPVIIFRPFNIYGHGQRADFLIPTILNQLKTGKIGLQDPFPKRDFVYIDDVIDCLLKAAIYNNKFDVFNIGYGESISVREVVNTVISIYNKIIKVEYNNKKRANETVDCFANTNKLQNRLHWAPKITIREGLEKTLNGMG